MKKVVLLVIGLVVGAGIGIGVYYFVFAPPQADFEASTTRGTAPLTVSFTDQSKGNVSSWAWDFDNDGTVDSTTKNAAHTYSTAGKYTVSLKVSGRYGSDIELKRSYIRVTGPTWHRVSTFSGTNSKTTPSFTIYGEKWRVTWSATADPKWPMFSVFSFFVYPEGEGEPFVQSFAHTGSDTNGTTYIFEGESSFYIKVLTANLERWSIEVESYR